MKKVILGLVLLIIISIFAVTVLVIAMVGPETTKTEVVSKTEETTKTDKEDENDIPYKYPITVESEEWKTLTLEDKIKLCQVPEDQLKSLSTLALYKTVVDFPYFSDIDGYNTYILGIEFLSAKLNAYEVLINRDDLAQVIFSEYKKIDLKEYTKEAFKLSSADFLLEDAKVEFMEYLLTIKDVHNNLSAKEKEELSDLAYKNYKLKINKTYFKDPEFIYQVAYISGTIDSFGKIESESDNDFRLKTPSGIVDVNKMYNPK